MSKQITTLSLGTDPLSKLLPRYAIPAIIAMTSTSLFNIIDSVFIGHGVGAFAIWGMALTMPIMAPFSELIGLSKQATVMAFQFGDGFTNLITPTSGVLIAVLGVSRIPYDKGFKWAWKFILVLVILGFLLLIPTVLIPMNGF